MLKIRGKDKDRLELNHKIQQEFKLTYVYYHKGMPILAMARLLQACNCTKWNY